MICGCNSDVTTDKYVLYSPLIFLERVEDRQSGSTHGERGARSKFFRNDVPASAGKYTPSGWARTTSATVVEGALILIGERWVVS